MSISFDIAPFMDVGVIDADQSFLNNVRNAFVLLGFQKTYATSSKEGAIDLLRIRKVDIALIEISDDFEDTWNVVKSVSSETLVVGMTFDRTGKKWMSAIKRGADSILLEQYAPSLLEPMLSHLLGSAAARRCKIVQFPHEGRELGKNWVTGAPGRQP